MTNNELIEVLKRFDGNAKALVFSIINNEVAEVKEVSKYEDLGILITSDKI